MARTGGSQLSLQDIYSGLRDQGLTHNQAANFAGVLQHESGGYTGSFGGQPTERGGVLNSGGAYGLAQFNGSRQGDLAAYAQARGMSPSDPSTQLGFIVQDAQNRGINLDSTRDIVNRYEVPRADLRAGEIANANRYASSIDANSYTGTGSTGTTGSSAAPGSGTNVTTDAGDGTITSFQDNGDGSASVTLGSAGDTPSLSNIGGATFSGLGNAIGSIGGALGLPPAVTGALQSALGLSGATGAIAALGGGNISGFNAAGPVQASPGLVTATNQVASNTKEGDKAITDGVKTAGQTIGQAITTQSQSWLDWAKESFVRLAFIVTGLVLFAAALYYFARPQIDDAVAGAVKVAKKLPVPV